jgi:hypothetical protein
VRLTVSDESLAAYLEAGADDAAAVFRSLDGQDLADGDREWIPAQVEPPLRD